MGPRSSVLLFLLGISLVINEVASLKCYECDSITNPDCLNIPSDSNKFLVDCTFNNIGRRRKNPTCYHARGNSTKVGGAIVRGCVERNIAADGCSTFVLSHKLAGVQCDVCTTDKCNGKS